MTTPNQAPNPEPEPPQYNQPPQNRAPHNQPQSPVPLPSRTPATVVTIIGAVLMFLIAPMVFVGSFTYDQGVNLEDTLRQGVSHYQVENGAEINVRSSGLLSLDVNPANQEAQCSLTRGNETYQFTKEVYDEDYDEYGPSAVMTILGVEEGRYQLECEGLSDSATITLVDGSIATALARSAIVAVTWATVVAVIGFVMFVAGLIWLIVINRQRAKIYYGSQMNSNY